MIYFRLEVLTSKFGEILDVVERCDKKVSDDCVDSDVTISQSWCTKDRVTQKTVRWTAIREGSGKRESSWKSRS